MAKKAAYTYTIKEIIKYIDGDTVDVIVDLGFHVTIKKRVRLHGINTPETRTRNKSEKKKGLLAKQRLIELCEQQQDPDQFGGLILKCHGLGKYGRILGEIFNGKGSVNKMLVMEGHAVEYHGGKR
jgi:micrococcal nuclease